MQARTSGIDSGAYSDLNRLGHYRSVLREDT